MVTPSLVAVTLFFAAPVGSSLPARVEASVEASTTVAVRPTEKPEAEIFAPTAKGVCLKLATCSCAPQKNLERCVRHLEAEAAQRRATMPRGLEAMLVGMGMDAPQGPHALSWDQTVRAGCEQACAAWGVPLKRRTGLGARVTTPAPPTIAPAPRAPRARPTPATGASAPGC